MAVTVDPTVSPALSTSVLRCFAIGSLSNYKEALELVQIFTIGSQIAHVHDASILCFKVPGGSIFVGCFERALPCDSEISASPFPGDVIRLGGRNCDVRTYYIAKLLVNG